MKPGDLLKFEEKTFITDDMTAIMIVLQVKETNDPGWDFCTSGRKGPSTVDVFYPTKGVRTYESWSLKVISDDHTSVEHIKLTALAFAGSCSSTNEKCQ